MGRQWGLSQIIFKLCIKQVDSFTKLKQVWANHQFSTLKAHSLILAKTQSLRTPKSCYKTLHSAQNQTNHILLTKAETLEQKFIQTANILKILNSGGRNMDTRELSLSSLQLFSISFSRWLWVELFDLLCFYAFLAFWFLPC